MSEQNVMVETARRAKSALRKAFPGTKFSVQTSSSICVEWADDGPSPTVEQVKDVVLTIGGVEVSSRSNNERWLRMSNGRGAFVLLATASPSVPPGRRSWSASSVSISKQREAVEAVRRAKWEQEEAIERAAEPPVQSLRAPEEPAVFEAFEALRQRAETDVAFDPERSRRPSWGAPMVLEGELLEACTTLGYLAPDAKPIARLWATFADPKRSRRSCVSVSAVNRCPGSRCRGFELYAGSERGDRSSILFEAQRAEGGQVAVWAVPLARRHITAPTVGSGSAWSASVSSSGPLRLGIPSTVPEAVTDFDRHRPDVRRDRADRC